MNASPSTLELWLLGLSKHLDESYITQASVYGDTCDVTLTVQERDQYLSVGKYREVLQDLGMMPDRITVTGKPYNVVGVYGTDKGLDDVHAKHGGEVEIGVQAVPARWRRILRKVSVCGIALSVLDEWKAGEPPEEE